MNTIRNITSYSTSPTHTQPSHFHPPAFLHNEIGMNTRLETLELSTNQLSSLPPSISSLKFLKTVDLSNNWFKTFPIQLCHLKSLNSLDLSSNKLTSLPDEVCVCMFIIKFIFPFMFYIIRLLS